MKLATWNVNSIRARLAHVVDWVTANQPDVLCLQETKVVDADFPYEPLRAAGYHVAHVGQKSYNGVATLTREVPTDIAIAPAGLDGEQKRLLALSVGGVRIVNVYAPNGERVGSEKYQFKLRWFAALRRYVTAELAAHSLFAVVGDFNVAPEERDVYDPRLWQNQVLFSPPERAALKSVVEGGLMDVFRRFEQPPASYTWWDYRAGAFRRNLGLRIDHVYASSALAQVADSCVVDKAPRALERPSDHAPVVADFQ